MTPAAREERLRRQRSRFFKRRKGMAVRYDYDLICIGLGPAGMAVSAMASEMGLKVCAIEKKAVGGECMNVGCIPSKALLRMAKTRSAFDKLADMELEPTPKPAVRQPFRRIQESLDFISQKKTMAIFTKTHLVYQKGPAQFVDPHTVSVAGEKYRAKRIFICVGTRPQMPAIPGIETVDCLTNENLFKLEAVPESLIIVGGGAIACEMAQAFGRLGSKVTLVVRGPRLLWREFRGVSEILEDTFEKEGIVVLKERKPRSVEQVGGRVLLHTDSGETVEAARLLAAAGRKMDFGPLSLDTAGVRFSEKGIVVDKYLRTSQPHIYACGDCNGYRQFSHAAMHQGMIALLNGILPWPLKQDFRKFAVPWTTFTEPQISHVGPRETQLTERGVKFEAIEVRYEDYGAAIAEKVDVGFVRVLADSLGKIHSATIVGEGSGEMINEWALAVQKKIRLHDVMLLQHSFPTMGFLSKRVAEVWMMNRMQSKTIQRGCRFLFRL
jgi:pyruvate/2-oxoglutarate dehydrogenase complex dihydrolipoamide dehydrogenase (E3) component